MVQSLKMSAPALFMAIFVACAFTFAAAQTSCRGRCGGEYNRGSDCQCDYECIVHDECCKDYESQCTTRDSCLGRCGEPFKRGRRCTCDSDCIKYNQCCSDYKNTCGTDEAMNGPDSNTPPGETSSCDNVNNNKPKEPSEVEQSEDPNVTPPTFSEGDDPDDYQMPLVTPDPQEETGNADNLDDPYSETGLQDPEPIPESTSGYEPSPTDLPEPATSDPSLPNSEDDSKLEPTPEEMFTQLPPTDEAPGGPSDNRPTQANTDLLPSDQADAEGPTESTDASNPEEQSDPTHTSEPGTTSPQLTSTSSVSSQASTQPTPSSESYPGSPSVTPEIQPEGQDELQPGGSEVLPDDELLPEGQIVDQSTSTSTLQPEDLPSEAENEDSPNADLNQSSTTTINPSLATTTASTVASKPTTTGLVSTGPTDGSSSTPGNPEPTSGSSAPQTPSTTTPDSSPSDSQDGDATSSQADNGPEPAATVASKPTTGLVSTEPTDGSSPSPGNPEPTSGSSTARTPSTTTPDSSLSDTEDRNATSSQADNGPEPGSESGLGVRGDNPDIWNGPGPSPTDPAQDPGPSPTDPAQHHGPSPTDPAQDPGPSPTDPAQHHGPSPTDPAQDPGPSPTDPAQDQGVDDATPAPTSLTQTNPTSKPHSKPDQTKPPLAKPGQVKPTSKPKPKPVEIAPPNIDNIRDYQADGNNDTNLCSGRPASAITTLGNGTMVVFQGHYFWVLDGNRVPGPARGITETWGVPSPVDTVFTRCNCQGKTYIFKGAQYWRFNNDMMDAGYPKPISTGFDGLRGHITAALSVPEYRQRKESVFFFKRGGQVQKYSYQFGTRPTCGSTGRRVQYAVYTIRTRTARQAASNLGSPINIRVSWRGFPTAVTSAVSVPTRGVLDGYKYYVFSRSKYYNVRMDGEQPAIVTPQSTTAPKNSANDFFKCPKEV